MSGGYVPTGNSKIRVTSKGKRSLVVEVRCGCGKLAWVSPADLKRRAGMGCKSCALVNNAERIKVFSALGRAEHKKKREASFNPFAVLLTRKLRELRSSKRHECTITVTHMRAVWTGRCALSGLAITLPIGGKNILHAKCTASLDRIDSSIGYIPGNIQWVHKIFNRMKNNHSDARFIELCKIVAAHNGGCDSAADAVQSAAPPEDRP